MTTNAEPEVKMVSVPGGPKDNNGWRRWMRNTLPPTHPTLHVGTALLRDWPYGGEDDAPCQLCLGVVAR